MKATLALAAVAALVLAAGASAKGPIQACGASRCAALGDERTPAIPLSVTAKRRLRPPARPAPYYSIRYAGVEGTLGYWIPSARLVRLRRNERAVWVVPTGAQVARLRRATRGIAPRAAPAGFETVEVDYHRVADARGYLSLYSIGTPVAAAPGAGGWARIFAFSNRDTPWSDGANRLSVARRGSYLRRDGQLVRLPAGVADRIRAGLPLD